MNIEPENEQTKMVLLYADAYQLSVAFQKFVDEFPAGFDGDDYFSRCIKNIKEDIYATQSKINQFLTWVKNSKDIGYFPFDDAAKENAKQFLAGLEADIERNGTGWEGMRALAADPTLFPHKKFFFGKYLIDDCQQIRKAFD